MIHRESGVCPGCLPRRRRYAWQSGLAMRQRTGHGRNAPQVASVRITPTPLAIA